MKTKENGKSANFPIDTLFMLFLLSGELLQSEECFRINYAEAAIRFF